MNTKIYEFDAMIEAVPEKGGAYIRFPYDIRTEFGKGRVKANITFDGEPYCGSIVNMGIRNEAGEICYISGILKSILKKLAKSDGDVVHVFITER